MPGGKGKVGSIQTLKDFKDFQDFKYFNSWPLKALYPEGALRQGHLDFVSWGCPEAKER